LVLEILKYDGDITEEQRVQILQGILSQQNQQVQQQEYDYEGYEDYEEDHLEV